MKTTLIEALETAMKGDFDKAWEIAQKDEGLRPGITKAEWIAWAKINITEEEDE